MLLRSQLDFTISHLNIHGLDNNFGCKIPDLEKILINDINILTETWSCTHDKNIPNFLTIELPPNKLDKRKTGRSSGGTLIYYKQYLQNQIKIIKSHKNYLWLEIDKCVFYNRTNNLRICTLYIPPQESKYYTDEIFEELVDDIIDFSPGNEDVMIIGDFNARTNCLPDHIPAANHTDGVNSVIPNLGHFLKRSNCDTGYPNKHGRNLINLCRSTNLRILNGRKFGDTIGNLTCISHNGASCIDYALASNSLFDKISLFYVSEQSSLSDHSKITAHLQNKKIINYAEANYDWTQLKNRFVWDEESPANFRNTLNSEKIKLKINNLKDQFKADCNPDLISSELTSIFHSAANASLKHKPSKHKQFKGSPMKKKWFDSDCSNLKRELNSFSKQKHKEPFNELARIKYRDKLKQYKYPLHVKRQNFWNRQITKLQYSLYNDNFWDTWKDFDEKIRRQSTAIQDGMVWENYYKKLFSTDQSINIHCSTNENSNNSTLNDKIETNELLDTIAKLKNKKAAGFDGISNEMIKNCNSKMTELIKMTLNLMLKKGIVPTLWCQGLITPLYKKGCKNNPDNYRGICVANALLKLLCLLLNNRLKSYLKDKNIIYGSEVWGPYLYRNPNLWDSCEVERIHTQFLKRLLGVNRSTTNTLVRGELGRYPLSMPLNCRTNNFIKHILNESEPHSLVSQALEYENSVNHRQTMGSYMNNLTNDLKKNGFNTDSIALLSKHATKEALTQNHQTHWKSILNDCPKALSYKTYKSHFTYENYLSLITNRSHRRILSKLRLSDYCLAIERGRHFKPL